MSPHDVEKDAEEPSFERRSTLELVEAPVRHEEDFLVGVVERGLGHAQSSQAAPDEIEMALVERGKIRKRPGRGLFGRSGSSGLGMEQPGEGHSRLSASRGQKVSPKVRNTTRAPRGGGAQRNR